MQGRELLGSNRIVEHSVYITLPNEPQLVWGIRTDILQVILNLALNACEASSDKKNIVDLKVMLSGTPYPKPNPDLDSIDATVLYTQFSISDSGVGLVPEVRVRLFDRYFTTKGNAGSGLGLAIIAKIIRDNEAVLWIESEVGSGTTITVAWPKAAEAAQNLKDRYKQNDLCEQTSLIGKNIIVVDDSADVADTLAKFLIAKGATVVATSDPFEAKTLLLKKPDFWSALVTDLHMPLLTGADLAVVAAGLEPALPTILVTSSTRTVIVDPHLFASILLKPCSSTQLLAAWQLVLS